MNSKPPYYRSYLLRLWRVGGAVAPNWWASLEDVRTHERRNFASLEQLCTFLALQLLNGAEDTEPLSSPEALDYPSDSK